MAIHCANCGEVTYVQAEADRVFCYICGSKTNYEDEVVGDGLLPPPEEE